MTGNFPVGGPIPPSYGPVYPPPPPKPSRAGVWLGSVACVLAAAALVVGVVALVTAQREPASVATAGNRGNRCSRGVRRMPRTSSLCEAIAPLMKESDDRNACPHECRRSQTRPARDPARFPNYKTDTLGLGITHAGSSQRARGTCSVSDSDTAGTTSTAMLLYSENMLSRTALPIPMTTHVWDAKAVDYGGPLATCYKLGIKW